jgi:hypothetical protein
MALTGERWGVEGTGWRVGDLVTGKTIRWSMLLTILGLTYIPYICPTKP